MADSEQRELLDLLDIYNAHTSLIPELSDVFDSGKVAQYLGPLPADPLSCMTIVQLKLKIVQMQHFVERYAQQANKYYNESFLKLHVICKLPKHRTNASLNEITKALTGDVAREACVHLWYMQMYTANEMKVRTMHANLNLSLVTRAKESEDQLRSELESLKGNRTGKKEARASEKALARVKGDLKAAMESAAEQKKVAEQLSSQLSEKQAEVKRLQREVSNGIRKLRKAVKDTAFCKIPKDEESVKASVLEALAESAAKLIESEKESKKQCAAKIDELEHKVTAL